MTVEERFGTRRVTGPQAVEFLYLAQHLGSGEDETDVKEAILAASPATYEGLTNQGITDFQQLSADLFFATVSFGTVSLGFDPDQTQFFNFDTTGGTQHITQSLESIKTYFAGDSTTGSPWKGAIGVDSDGKNPAGV